MTVSEIIQLGNIGALVLIAWLGSGRLREIHLSLNSRLDSLLAAREQVGAERERVEQRARSAAGEAASAAVIPTSATAEPPAP